MLLQRSEPSRLGSNHVGKFSRHNYTEGPVDVAVAMSPRGRGGNS